MDRKKKEKKIKWTPSPLKNNVEPSKKKIGPEIFFYPLIEYLLFMAMAILSASVERFSVSRMRDFLVLLRKVLSEMKNKNSIVLFNFSVF